MRVLAADTSTPYCSVALCACDGDSRVLCETTVLAGRRHSELLLTITQDVLRLAGVDLGEIDLLAISTGPGSFTGLRVGVASWKGLAFGAGKPLIGVPTLAAMARRIGIAEGVVCPMLDARMEEVFAALYEFSGGDCTQVLAEAVGPVKDILSQIPAGAVIFGDGVLRYRAEVESFGREFQIAAPEFHYPTAATVAFEGYRRFRAGEPADAAGVVPVYLRKSQAEANKAASEAPVV